MNYIPFTQKGYQNLTIQLDNELSKRPEAVKTLARAREMGDLSENGLYKAARFELSSIDRQIRFLKNLIKYAKQIKPDNNESVEIGHFVTIENETGKKHYQIVGEYEANPTENKISFKSPIGHNLMNKKINDVVKIKTPSNTITFLITNISL